MVGQMKFFRIFLFVFFFLAAVWFLAISAKASHCGSGDYDCQIQEIQREIDDENYKDTRDSLDHIDPERAPHSTEDAKNFASYE